MMQDQGYGRDFRNFPRMRLPFSPRESFRSNRPNYQNFYNSNSNPNFGYQQPQSRINRWQSHNSHPYGGGNRFSQSFNRPWISNMRYYVPVQGPYNMPSLSQRIHQSQSSFVHRNPYKDHNKKLVNAEMQFEDLDEEYVPEPVKILSHNSEDSLPSGYSNWTDDSSEDLNDELSESPDFDHNLDKEKLSLCSPTSPRIQMGPISSFKKSLLKKSSNPKLPIGCSEDEDFFLEIHIAAVTQYVIVGKQRTQLKSAFGVWFGEGSEFNFSDTLPEERPQCIKAVLIFGSGRGIDFMKEKGFKRLKVIMESEFLIFNVADWAKKFMADASKGNELINLSNWDEYKYAIEIAQLCKTFQGMVVKWSHVSGNSSGIQEAKLLAQASLKPIICDINLEKQMNIDLF